MVFEGARLIPGDGNAAIENSVFVVENGRFMLVGQQGDVQVPEGATHVDLNGKTVMPAKIDLHGHLCYEDVVEGTTAKANVTRENCIEQLERLAYMGFSTVVSIADLMEREVFPGDHLDVYQTPRSGINVPAVGERQPWGDVPLQLHGDIIPNAAQFFTTGPAVAFPGGGAGGHQARNDVMYPVGTEAEARRAVRDYVSSFTSRNLELPFIKIWVDDRGDRVETLSPPLYRAVIDDATQLGVSVAAHTVTLADAKERMGRAWWGQFTFRFGAGTCRTRNCLGSCGTWWPAATGRSGSRTQVPLMPWATRRGRILCCPRCSLRPESAFCRPGLYLGGENGRLRPSGVPA